MKGVLMKIHKIEVEWHIVFDRIVLYTDLPSPRPDDVPEGNAILTLMVDAGTGMEYAKKNFHGIEVEEINKVMEVRDPNKEALEIENLIT